ncbi:MAG: HEAT repeat domain-containing protein, partial [Leptolyngbyaceae bacterium]|nr:HEAT repeat domain-containing protein [Leptolyngbyaceae bacterium]
MSITEVLKAHFSSEGALFICGNSWAIAKVIQEKPDDSPCDILINALDDPAEMVRSEAAAVLGNLAHKPAVPKLITLLEHSEWETRKSAALSLMKIGDKDALPALRSTLEKESDEAAQRILQLTITQLDKHQD